jgi:acyl carrier protein
VSGQLRNFLVKLFLFHRTKLNEAFGISLSATFAYDFPTIRKMRKRLEETSIVIVGKKLGGFDEKKFEAIIRNLLGMESGDLPEDTALSELGLDSIFATELRLLCCSWFVVWLKIFCFVFRTKLNETFSLSLSATFAYDFPTIRKMRVRVQELAGVASTSPAGFDVKKFESMVRGLLGMETGDLPEDIALSELGLDSIFATELR